MQSDRCVVRFSRARRALVAVLAGSCCSMPALAGGVDFQFNGPGISNWSNPLSWDIIGVPNAPNHNAFVSGSFAIDPTILTLDINVTLNNFQYNSPMVQFVSQGRTMTIGGTATFDGGMPVNFNGGGFAGTGAVSNSGVFNASGGVNAFNAGGFVNNAGGTLNVIDSTFTRNTGSFTNQGTINVTSTVNTNSAINGNSTLMNEGVLNFEQGAGGSRSLGLSLDNIGGATVNARTATTLGQTAGSYTNSGSFNVDATGSVTIQGSGVLTFTQMNGTLTNNGSFQSNAESFIFSGGNIVGNDIRINGGMLGITTDGTGDFDVISGTTFTGDIAPAQTIDVFDSALTAGTFTNRGRLSLTSTVNTNSQLTADSITNIGLLTTEPGAGGTRLLATNLNNINQVMINANTSLNNMSGVYTNTGIFTIAAGSTTTLSGSGVLNFNQNAGTLDNQGAFQSNAEAFNYNGGILTGNDIVINGGELNIATPNQGHFDVISSVTVSGDISSSQSVDVFNSTLTQTDFTNDGVLTFTSTANTSATLSAGTLTNTGTLDLLPGAGGTRTMSSNLNNSGVVNASTATNLSHSSGVFTNSGQFNIAPGSTTTLGGSGVLNFNQNAGTLDNQGAFQSNAENFNYNGGVLTGNDIIINGGQLNIATPNQGHFDVTSGTTMTGDISDQQSVDVFDSTLTQGDFTNDGVLTLTSTVNTNATLNAGMFSNTGTFDLLPGNGGVRFISSDLNNSGVVNASANVNLNRNSGVYINTGEFNIAPGTTTTLSAGGVPSFNQNAGTLNNNGTFQSNAENFSYNGGVLTGNDIIINGGQLDIATPNQGHFDVTSGTTMTGDISDQQSVDVFDSTLTQGDFTNDGVLTLTSTVSTNATLNAGMFTNTGTFDLLPGAGGVRFISSDLDNSGVVNASANVNLNRNSGVYINTGEFNIAPGTTTTLSAGGIPSFNQNAGTLNNNGTFQSNGENFSYNGGVLTGNDIIINGGELNIATPNQGHFDVTSGTTMTGDISNQQTVDVFDSTLSQGDFTNGGVLTLTSTVSTNATLNAGMFTNAGTLELLPGAGGARFIGANVSNTGEINAAASTTLNLAGASHTSSGVITVDTGVTFTVGGSGTVSFLNDAPGTIRGGGTLNLVSADNFTNDGTFSPEGDGVETGTLTVIGDWHQTGLGQLAIDILNTVNRGIGHDVLAVTQDADLDGLLVVSVAGNINPAESFTVLTSDELTGTFSNTGGGTVATTNGGQFDVIYTGDSVILTNYVPTPGALGLAGLGLLVGLRRRR